MQAYQATTTLSSTGTAVLVATPGFQGKEVEIKAGPINGGGSSVSRYSLGWGDGTRQSCDWGFADGTLFGGDKVTNKVVSVWANVGGTLTEVVSASNPTFTATQFKLDVATIDTNYKISVKITG